MKKLFLSLAISILSLTGFSQQLLTYQINAKVLLSNGDSIPTGAVCSFNAHVENVATTGKIAYDISWWINQDAKTKGYDRVIGSTSNRGVKYTSWYQTVTDPTQVTYTSMLGAIKAYLESIYGAGKVVVL